MTTSTPSFTVRSPVDLIALTPHLLGFWPGDSVVLLTFPAPGETHGAFHARVDLPPDAGGQHEVADLIVRAVTRNAARTAALLVFSTDAEASRAQAGLLATRLHAAGVRVLDVLRVEDDRYFAALDPGAAGTSYDLSTHPFTAQRVFEGHVVHPSREALADTLVGTDEELIGRVARFAARHRQPPADPGPEAAWMCALVDDCLGHDRAPDCAETGRLLVDCADAGLRDVLLGRMRRIDAARHLALWREVVRRAPDDLLPPAAAVLAFAAWLAGDGALSWCAVERCLERDAEFRLAHRIADLLDGAVPPSDWERRHGAC